MNKYLILIIVIWPLTLLGQIQHIPAEQLAVHLNDQLFYTGDELKIKVFSRLNQGEEASLISKIAYVELIDEHKTKLVRKKIRLQKGEGNGDIFINHKFISGSYKLLVYTQWMLNNEKQKYVALDLHIINPYKPRISIVDTTYNFTKTRVELSNTYKQRQQIKFKIEKMPKANLSVSVRKLNAFESMAVSGFDDFKKTPLISTTNVGLIMPELRGELIKGHITTDQKLSLKDKRIAISIAGKDNILKITKTDAAGRFYFNLHEFYISEKGLIQMVDKDRKKYKIHIEEVGLPDDVYQNLEFLPLKINKQIKEEISNRSLWNQIENAYGEIHQDSTLLKTSRVPFYGSKIEEYDLDEYKRFPTMKEVFVELIDQVRIVKDKQKDYLFVIRGTDNYFRKDILPLVFVDGVLVQDYNSLVAYKAKKIKRIKFIKDKYYYGTLLSRGILAFETIDGDYDFTAEQKDAIEIKLDRPELDKIYHTRNHATPSNERVPDYRTQLYWNPSLAVREDKINFNFYTSDVTGVFKVEIKGFTEAGEVINDLSYFEVKK